MLFRSFDKVEFSECVPEFICEQAWLFLELCFNKIGLVAWVSVTIVKTLTCQWNTNLMRYT